MTSSSSSINDPEAGDFIRSRIREVPDFPIKGVVFRDITTLTADPEALSKTIDLIYDRCSSLNITKVVGAEARGFIFGSLLAYKLGCGFVPVRKPGKLPFATVKSEYSLEYGTDSIEIHIDALTSDDNVLVIDDLLATGGTLAATCKLVEKLEAKIACIAVVLELSYLGGQDKFKDYNYFSLVKYDSE